MNRRISSFAAFWPFYLSQHASASSRWLHAAGTSAAIANAVRAVATLELWWLPLSLVLGYGPAWVGHFIIEKNRPATFTYPLWSLLGDFRMLANMCVGRFWTGTPVAPMTEAEALEREAAGAITV
jgi:hypothetical protein